jgi:hypothetical protein
MWQYKGSRRVWNPSYKTDIDFQTFLVTFGCFLSRLCFGFFSDKIFVIRWIFLKKFNFSTKPGHFSEIRACPQAWIRGHDQNIWSRTSSIKVKGEGE